MSVRLRSRIGCEQGLSAASWRSQAPEVGPDTVWCRRRSPPVPSPGWVRERERLSRRSRCLAPALLGGLAGDAEPGADLGPGIAERAQARDGLADGGVDLVCEIRSWR